MKTPQKYIAASVPRYIRTSRLWYLRVEAIIGSKLVKPIGAEGMVYDVIMLPENEYLRAKCYLAAQTMGNITLERSELVAAYIPQDTLEFIVPSDESEPQQRAIQFFVEKFDLMDHCKYE